MFPKWQTMNFFPVIIEKLDCTQDIKKKKQLTYHAPSDGNHCVLNGTANIVGSNHCVLNGTAHIVGSNPRLLLLSMLVIKEAVSSVSTIQLV